MATVVLASRSPRRRELLASAGLDLRLHPVDVDESSLVGEDPRALVERLARSKASAAVAAGTLVDGALAVVGADTVVCLRGELLGKPATRAIAAAMLRRLAGQPHMVYTGWSVINDRVDLAGIAATEVTFRPLGQREIELYLNTDESYDKAGAYGIQGPGGALIDTVAGSFTNVVGLPLKEVLHALAQAGHDNGGIVP